MNHLDALRNDIKFSEELAGQRLNYRSTWGIFSPREIDDGTRLLMNYIKVNPEDDCFDLGCGYGPIGLTLAKLAPQGQTLLVDKDFMAVEYSNKNATLNQINNAKAMLSNGFQHVDPALRFDLIASNVPAKVGKEMMSLMLHDARDCLKPGGRLYLVTINGLRQYMKRNLKEIFGHYKKIKQGAKYTIHLATIGEQ
ncbi:MAG TPA: class I SAM-dependent methyltransferase [Leucothrix mucor]|uniref:Class I SAM-dependent methyltransferase n=1 Tax=Leucothrix mucor TaxID=45248 RepID=A0A7V2T354_LEUMU|nr:class I SAM-dependent methyltransferase [Leucothrix mucor]